MASLFQLVKDNLLDVVPKEYIITKDSALLDFFETLNILRDELFNSGVATNGDLSIEDLRFIYDPERSNRKFLFYLAKMLDIDFSLDLPDRIQRIRVFNGMKLNRKHGTVEYLMLKIYEVTGVMPDILFRKDRAIGWDQLGESGGTGDIMEVNGYALNFYGGILWDQNNDYYEVFAPQRFIWQVYRTSLLIDIKNDGVFDPNPSVNAQILEKVYYTVAKYKEATMQVAVGYIDSNTATDIILKIVYNTNLWLSPGDPLPPEHQPRIDPGIF